MHTLYDGTLFTCIYCRSRTRLTRMRSELVIALSWDEEYMSCNTCSSSNLSSKNGNREGRNNPKTCWCACGTALLCANRGKRVLFFMFRNLALSCLLLFILHSWTCGIQPEGKMLLQIKLRLWRISGQYWKLSKFYDETHDVGDYYWSDYSGCVFWTTLLLQISLLWSHKRWWHQLAQLLRQQSHQGVCSRCSDWLTHCFLARSYISRRQ